MTVGIPNFISNAYNRLNLPNKVEVTLLKIYASYLRYYVKVQTWLKFDRKEEAKLKPLNLIWIDPQEIEIGTQRREIEEINGTLLPNILNGNWDKEKISRIEERSKYQAMEQHFVDGKAWEETEYYQSKLEELQRTGSTDHGGKITSEKELNQIFKNIDGLYSKIKEEGYKKQKEIREKQNIVNKDLRPDHFSNELNEVMVDIGRDGEIIFEENRHRFYIARILGIEKIPVRILIRHSKWQNKRNNAIKNPEKLTEEQKQHPDLKYLVE